MFDNDDEKHAPKIAALFIVVFDQRIGYKILWQRSLPDLAIDGVVEYKSLPSGLHHVESDFIYFTHADHAGLSGFTRRDADDEHRSAQFVAVGVLARKGSEQLGRIWEHAERLAELSKSCDVESERHDELQRYWDEYKLDDRESSDARRRSKDEDDAEQSERKNQAMNGSLSTHHPAFGIDELFDTFGPLMFPIHRATLLRKRILFSATAPILRTCTFVYLFSLFSTISNQYQKHNESSRHIPALFNVGVHDIAELSTYKKEKTVGYIACTTDGIIATKRDLYDILIEFPQDDDGARVKIENSDGSPVLATQRDLRRFQHLRRELKHAHESIRGSRSIFPAEEDDTQPLLSESSRSQSRLDEDAENEGGEEEVEEDYTNVTEMITWSETLYSSFLWWSSSGESFLQLTDEASQDNKLVEDLIETSNSAYNPSKPRHDSHGGEGEDVVVSGKEMTEKKVTVLIAYFHRLTRLYFDNVKEIIDDESRVNKTRIEGEDREEVQIDTDDMMRLGLDEWSATDALFIREFGKKWWRRNVTYSGRGVECCGLRLT